MLKVAMSGAIESLSIVSTLDEAMTILHSSLENPNAFGHVEDMETGEVLVSVEKGNVTYIAPDTMTEMMDAIFEADPLLAIMLIAEILDADRG